MKFRHDYNYALNHNLIGSYDRKTKITVFTRVPDYSATSGKAYSKAGLELEQNKPEIDKLLTELGALSANVTDSAGILASDLKSLLPMVSTEATRPYLQGVFCDFEDSKLVATNGYTMRVIDGALDRPSFKNIILSGDVIKTLFKVSGRDIFTLCKLADTGYYSLIAGVFTVVFKEIEREYVKYQAIITRATLPHSVMFGDETIKWIKEVVKAAKADKVKIPLIKICNQEMTAFDGKMRHIVPTTTDCPTTYFNAFLLDDVLQVGTLNISGALTIAMQSVGKTTNLIMPCRGIKR